jgi:hypothetical protein
MRHAFFSALVLIISFYALSGQDKRSLPAQVQRGQDLFLNSSKGLPCGNCHSLGGVGTAVGPDLKTLGSAVGPHGLVMAMHMTMTAYVQEVTLASGITYAGMPKGKQGDQMEIWDLSQTPPVLRKLSSKEVVSMKGNTTWKHPPATVEYTTHELADLVGFVKWASTGSSKVIKPADVAEAK